MSCFFERKSEPSNFIQIANFLFLHLNVLKEKRLLDFDMVNIGSHRFAITANQLRDSEREKELAEVLLKDKLKDIQRYHKIKNPTLEFKEEVGVSMMMQLFKQKEKVLSLMISLGGDKETFVFTGFSFNNDPSKYFNFFYNQIEYLNPLYGYIDSTIISGKQQLPEFFFGWMSYFSNELSLPPIPNDYQIDELPERGKVIITTKDFFDPKNNAEHYNKAMRLVELFREYNIIRPKL